MASPRSSPIPILRFCWFSIPLLLTWMAYGPEINVGIFETSGHLIGRSLIDDIRKTFSPRRQTREGDFFMDRSRNLLQVHLNMIENDAKIVIRRSYKEVLKIKASLEGDNGSPLQKLLQARKYRRLSKSTYMIVKIESGRAVDNLLMNQLVDATSALAETGGFILQDDPQLQCYLASIQTNPFGDLHAISTLSDVNVNDLNEVEMTTFENEATGGAVVLNLHTRDAAPQHIVTTFSTAIFSGERTDRDLSQPVVPPEAVTAISSHPEDGSIPRLVTMPLPYFSPGQGISEEGEAIDLRGARRTRPSSVGFELTFSSAETRTISSVDVTEIFGPSEEP
ncbi:hypothetical protein F5148DRAFT_1289649 [Russula earlei]|uniref:Uncharacterized protein n=1 Tax=Russula earlei TaxID=71964 RepID=A0ACC0TX77_9AGAM|nr:hypothetical protein F5148DRAFT_1289649 [Russula earlei]